MFTSDTKTTAIKVRKTTDPIMRTVYRYLIASLATVTVGHVYEHFSHGVYARGMFWAFLIPLMGGAAVFRVIALLRPILAKYGVYSANYGLAGVMYHSGIATLTVGSMFKGALDIYGTSSSLVNVYWVVGAALTVASAVMCLSRITRTGRYGYGYTR